MNSDFTCVDCEKRYVGCHSNCSKYLEEREKRDELLERMHKRKREIDDFCFVRKTMKTRHYKEI